MKYIPQLLLTIAIISYSLLSLAQSSSPSVKLANWQGNKKAALCVTLDDGCEQQFTVGKQIMDSVGIKGTFFIITDLNSNCDGANSPKGTPNIYQGTGSPEYWDTLQNTINQGHEIGAHTVHHPELASVTWKDYGIDSVAKEIYMSKATLEQMLHKPGEPNTPYSVLTFAYPYGDGQDDTTIIDTIQKYFIAARAAGTYNKKITWDTYADANPSNTGFINYYYQVESYACEDTTSIAWYNTMLHNAIKNSGWFIPMYHNIAGSSLENAEYSVSADNFRAQMEAIIAKQDSFWIAPFKDVARYSKENISSTTKIQSSDSSTTVITLTDTIKNPAFCVPLTLLVSNFTYHIDSIMQAGDTLSFCTPTTGQVQFNAIPNAGDITIYTGSPVKKSGGITSISAPSAEDYFELYQNVPNPALSTTAISYNLKQAGPVTLELFDISGTNAKTLVSEQQATGKYSYSLNTDNLQAGIYFYRLTSGNTFDVKKMVVIR